MLGKSRRWAILLSLLAASPARGEERPKFADLISRYDRPTVGTVAEYCAALFLKASKGQSAYGELLRQWRARASSAKEAAPIPLANRVYHSDFETLFSIRTALVYDKGSLLLAALHKELGDQTFLTFLKSFQKSFRWKFGSTRHVVGLLQFITKKDFTPFFEANFWGTGMPKI